VIVQRRYGYCGSPLWKTFRSKPNAIPVDDKNCSPSTGIGVRLQTGMLFGFITEWWSRLQTGIAFAFDRIPQPTDCWVLGGLLGVSRFCSHSQS